MSAEEVAIDGAAEPVSPAPDRRSPDTSPQRTTTRGGGPLARFGRLLTGAAGQTVTSGLLLGFLLHLRFTYVAGDRDHLVLSPVGMQWADPDLFRGDWAIATAPQPHWLFDSLTWFGATTGTLPAVYLIYWLVALGIFGAATTVLSRAWAARHSWLAVLALTVFASVAPLYFLGSGTPFYATALPNVLGGCLVYLTVAGLLTRRHLLAAIASACTALAHVQHGTVTVVLLLMVAVLVFWRTRRVDRALLGGVLATAAIVVVNLKVRPVAGHLGDFAEACRLFIPFHCEASTWPRGDAWGGIALVLLALLTVLYLAREEWPRWLLVVGLPALALVAGVLADRRNVPVLGPLAQGLNIYRLSLLLLPLAMWGVLTPLLAKVTPRQRWLLLAAVLFLGHRALGLSKWGLEVNRGGTSAPWMVVAAGALVVGVAVHTVPGLVRRTDRATGVVLAALIACLVLSASFGSFRLRPLDPTIFPNQDLTVWGNEVQRLVPPGEQLMVPPWSVKLRMATRRGVVVDCKYGPYGGPAWQEYKTRLAAAGGLDQCQPYAYRTVAYGTLTAEQLISAARRYGARYIVVDANQPWRVAALETKGWTKQLGPYGSALFVLLKAPD